MDDVLQRAPTLAAQRSTVKAHVQSCTLAHLASWLEPWLSELSELSESVGVLSECCRSSCR